MDTIQDLVKYLKETYPDLPEPVNQEDLNLSKNSDLFIYLTTVSSHLVSLPWNSSYTQLYPFETSFTHDNDNLIYLCSLGCSNEVYLGLQSDMLYHVNWDDYTAKNQVDWSILKGGTLFDLIENHLDIY